ncbi:MAG: glycosyltransferase family 2 protein [Gemmatimonadaceae bacterium]|nr:glycosyltransferase family 2 protein [Gemmatimonadaceae bacterium]
MTLAGWIVALSAALIAWIVVGYPLAVLTLARHRPAPAIRRDAITPAVTAVVAVRNGAAWLAAKLESLLAQDYPRDRLTILVVSDGSTDDTARVAAEYARRDPRITSLQVPHGGKAAALNAAVPHAAGELLVLTDVRQPLAPDCIREIVRPFADPSVGVVSGELRIRDAGGTATLPSTYWRLETSLRHALARVDSTLGATGPIYAVRRSLVRPLPPGLILDDMYLPLGAFFDGYRLVTEPRAVAWDEEMDVATEFRRKVRTLAGNYQLLRYEPRLLLPWRNRMFGHYLSYKIGRLLLPQLLIVLFVATIFLPAPARWPLLAFQLAGYLVAAADPWVPSTSPLKRVSAPARSVLAMMAAAFLAQKVFFVPPESLWIPTRTT